MKIFSAAQKSTGYLVAKYFKELVNIKISMHFSL